MSKINLSLGSRLKTKKKKITPKTDYFLNEEIARVDYKDTDILRKFINHQGRIINHTYNMLTAKTQRRLAKAIKRARQMALLSYTIVEQKEQK